ncbi:SDR family NAD(P)-dependent oxidoreductase [Streptomyces acidicola]|uniref:SDR family NAD(P)-dependent oxidoreductase n=1 Tax=Streptomyces acidicola TaxID=2596892 RepID=UPI003801D5D6
MTAIAIIGAGPGVGLAVARRFGREGFAVALLSRRQTSVDELAATLESEGVTARGFAADVRDPDSVERALASASASLGPIEVLQYSPLPQREFLRPVLETSREDFATALQFSLFGAMAATQQVLEDMRSTGRGTLVFVNGGTAARPRTDFAGTSVAFAAESAYARTLHDAVKQDGIHVTQLIIPGAIPAEDPERGPAAVADRIWQLHQEREGFRHFLTPMDED